MKFAYLLFCSKNNRGSKIPAFGVFAPSSDVGSVLAMGKPQDIFLWCGREVVAATMSYSLVNSVACVQSMSASSPLALTAVLLSF